VVRPSATNRVLLARFPGIFSSACPGSSRERTSSLTTSAAPPEAPGLVWLDPSSGRVTAWRRRATGHTDHRCKPSSSISTGRSWTLSTRMSTRGSGR
jgi:hypothetical protein